MQAVIVLALLRGPSSSQLHRLTHSGIRLRWTNWVHKSGIAGCAIEFMMVVCIGFSGIVECQAQNVKKNGSSEITAKTKKAITSSAPRGEVVLFRLATDVLPSATIQLANGVEVVTGDWQTLILARIGNGVTCTATIVGPNVVLMAAHCVDNPGSKKLRTAALEVDGRRLLLECNAHDDYLKRAPRGRVPRGAEDYALCLLDNQGVMPESLDQMRFEVVDARSVIASGESILMTGYGCTDLRVSNGRLVASRADNVLRIGDARIEAGVSSSTRDPTYVTVRSANGLEPALCPGDSGGPLFTGATTTTPNAVRRVRGVNSKIQPMQRNDGAFDIVSSISATGTPIFRDWAERWIRSRQVHKPIICGVNRDPGEFPCKD